MISKKEDHTAKKKIEKQITAMLNENSTHSIWNRNKKWLKLK